MTRIRLKPAFIVGNGPSRKDLNLNILKGHGTVFGCNALYREFAPKYELPDYLIAIDPDMIDEIKNSDFPANRFIVPPIQEHFESPQAPYYRDTNYTFRSNAGMNCIMEAYKKGYKTFYCIGFDFLIADEQYMLGNVFEGTDCYGKETQVNTQDCTRRVQYFDWFIGEHPIHCTIVLPRLEPLTLFKLNSTNISGMFYDDFENMLYTDKLR